MGRACGSGAGSHRFLGLLQGMSWSRGREAGRKRCGEQVSSQTWGGWVQLANSAREKKSNDSKCAFTVGSEFFFSCG